MFDHVHLLEMRASVIISAGAAIVARNARGLSLKRA